MCICVYYLVNPFYSCFCICKIATSPPALPYSIVRDNIVISYLLLHLLVGFHLNYIKDSVLLWLTFIWLKSCN